MLLSYTEICELIEQGVIENATYDNVNSSSLDIRLSEFILIERTLSILALSLKNKDKLPHQAFSLRNNPYILYPNEFILASSIEVFNLPNNISAEYKLKSSMARIGLEHLNAGWCDAGWNNSQLTLELKNVTVGQRIALHEGVGIGQIVFFKHSPVPENKSYAVRGRYNNQSGPVGVRKDGEK